MRDDLIRRKNNGEGAIERHWNSWTTWNNWQVDRDNDRKETADPYKKEGFFISRIVASILVLIHSLTSTL
jgi:hypothetical protein